MVAPCTETICRTIAQPCRTTPDPGCTETGAGVSTLTPKALLNGDLTDVDFDTVNFEEPPSSADLPNDGVVAGVLGTYTINFTMNFGATGDPGATATTFIYVNGVPVDARVHALGAAPSTQIVSTTRVLAAGDLVQLFVRQDGALEGVLLNSATLSILLPCGGIAGGVG